MSGAPGGMVYQETGLGRLGHLLERPWGLGSAERTIYVCVHVHAPMVHPQPHCQMDL